MIKVPEESPQVNKGVKKADFIVVGALLLAAALLYGLFAFGRGEGGRVEISLGGELQETYALDEDAEIAFPGNTVVIKDGRVHIEDSDCPDHLCEKQGEISKAGESLICLPNRLSVVIRGADAEDALDGVSY